VLLLLLLLLLLVMVVLVPAVLHLLLPARQHPHPCERVHLLQQRLLSAVAAAGVAAAEPC
jgi:hypothetical protein